MSRKGKGAALFELLYKDKGKTTTADGAMKMPSWFRTKGQGNAPAPSAAPPPGPGEPAGAATPLRPAPAEAPSPAGEKAVGITPLSAPAPATKGPSPLPVGSAGATPSRPMPVKPTLGPTRPMMSPAGGPTGPAKPANLPPQKVIPPWATNPWLQIEDGRVKLNLTTFAAGVVAGGAVIVLLLTFLIGRACAPKPKVAEAVPDKPAEKQASGKLDDALKGPADPTAASGVAGTGRSATGGTGSSSAGGGTGSAGGGTGSATGGAGGGPAGGAGTLPAGKFYVIIIDMGNKQAEAKQVNDYLVRKGFNVQVANSSGGAHTTVRTAQGTDRASADKLRKDIEAIMPQMAKELAPIVRYKADDPHFQPYVTSF
jgi:hypothetical protein